MVPQYKSCTVDHSYFFLDLDSTMKDVAARVYDKVSTAAIMLTCAVRYADLLDLFLPHE